MKADRSQQQKTLEWFSSPENVFCYHYEKLEKREKTLYLKLAEGLFGYEPEFTLYHTKPEQVNELYGKLKLDMPAAFFDEGLEIEWYPLPGLVKVRPRYRFGRKKAEEILSEILRRTDPILTMCRGKTDLEKETIIHDWFINNVSYDNSYLQNVGGSSFEMAGPLLWNTGVCSGICRAAKFIFDQLGIRCRILNGYVSGYGGRPDELHCWLMIKIYEQKPGMAGLTASHYHLDITFDLTAQTRRYFNMTEEEAFQDRVMT